MGMSMVGDMGVSKCGRELTVGGVEAYAALCQTGYNR